jgi:hypothetical protein
VSDPRPLALPHPDRRRACRSDDIPARWPRVRAWHSVKSAEALADLVGVYRCYHCKDLHFATDQAWRCAACGEDWVPDAVEEAERQARRGPVPWRYKMAVRIRQSWTATERMLWRSLRGAAPNEEILHQWWLPGCDYRVDFLLPSIDLVGPSAVHGHPSTRVRDSSGHWRRCHASRQAHRAADRLQTPEPQRQSVRGNRRGQGDGGRLRMPATGPAVRRGCAQERAPHSGGLPSGEGCSAVTALPTSARAPVMSDRQSGLGTACSL